MRAAVLLLAGCTIARFVSEGSAEVREFVGNSGSLIENELIHVPFFIQNIYRLL